MTGRGCASWEVVLHRLHHVWTDWLVVALSLCNKKIGCLMNFLSKSNRQSFFSFYRYHRLTDVNSQRLKRSRGLGETYEQRVCFVSSRKKTMWLMPMEKAVSLYLHWTVLRSLSCCAGVPKGIHCSLQGHRHRDMGQKTASLHYVLCSDQSPPTLVLSSLLFLPAVFFLEPELQGCVSVFSPLAVHKGSIVVVAL